MQNKQKHYFHKKQSIDVSYKYNCNMLTHVPHSALFKKLKKVLRVPWKNLAINH